MSLPTIAEVIHALKLAGVTGVEEYGDKLRQNRKIPTVYEDLLAEAYAALMFKGAEFKVLMRDSPDLSLIYNGEQIGAEVKRFHRKKQDDIDEQRMRDDFVSYGDTVPTEGVPAWLQVAQVALKKSSQLFADLPNILVIQSSSPHCIEDAEIMFAVNAINDRIAAGENGDIRRLNGIVLMSLEYNVALVSCQLCIVV